VPLERVYFSNVQLYDVILKGEIPYMVVAKKKKLVKIEELADDPRSRWLSIANFNRKKFDKLTGE
jgi:hypothetical protein